MLENDVYQILLSDGQPHSKIKTMIAHAIEYGSATFEMCSYRLVNTNSGMPAEFRLERI